MMLAFDEKEHRYFWDGKPVPNVTRALGPLTDFGMVAPDVLERARQRGIAVHRMVELWAKDDLDTDALPDWMRPVFVQWLKFVDDTGLEVLASEQKVYHPLFQYAGTLDLIVTMRAKAGRGIIDIKRSFLAGPSIGLQVAAYGEAVNATEKERDNRIQWRGALKLREDGPYRYLPLEDPTDFSMFTVALKHFQTGQILDEWKRKHS